MLDHNELLLLLAIQLVRLLRTFLQLLTGKKPKHRASPATTVVGRGPPLYGRLFDGGTDGSNPSSSSGESGELPYSAAGSSRSRRQCANEETSTAGRMALCFSTIVTHRRTSPGQAPR